jgi:hypothetical protein
MLEWPQPRGRELKALKNILSLLAVIALSPIYFVIAVRWSIELWRFKKQIRRAS